MKYFIDNKSLDANNYHNSHNGYLSSRKIETIPQSQQTDITHQTTETNTQIINYANANYLNHDRNATVILNPTPSLNENYLWIPEVSDHVAPGSDSMLTYIQSKYTTSTSLQNAITYANNDINDEIHNTQTEINNLENANQQNVSE